MNGLLKTLSMREGRAPFPRAPVPAQGTRFVVHAGLISREVTSPNWRDSGSLMQDHNPSSTLGVITRGNHRHKNREKLAIPCRERTEPGPMRVGGLTEEAVNATFTSGDRHRLIAKTAFDRANLRGFVPGYEVDDWLRAEKEVGAACGLVEPSPRWDMA